MMPPERVRLGMPHFNLNHFLNTMGTHKAEDVFVLQIGAMDGRTFDPVHDTIKRYGWAGLMVEPISEHFDALQTTYKDHPRIACANVAIAEKSGTASMYRVATQDVTSQNVPKWGLGASSLYADRNALSFDDIQPFVVQEQVTTITLPELLESHGVTHIDVLQIDAEGHDYHILKQLDFARFMPMVIHMEIVNLPKSEQNACKRLLDDFGYLHAKVGYDLLAVSSAFFQQFSQDS